MIIKVKGKNNCIQKLEEAQKLIREAQKLLHQIPMELELEMESDAGEDITDSAQDNQ
mgnify:CR=1 FL=1